MSGHLRSRATHAARKHKHRVVHDHGSLTMAQIWVVKFSRIAQWPGT
ncbi:hypothetical protein ABIC71_000937 [Herbaspirillum seropedicae]